MNPDEFFKKIVDYGADEAGITDRFSGNTELYQLCFCDFIEEPNFTLLNEAVKKKDYNAAFSAAHALKGLSGNLGLTAFYNTVSVLVESLRAEKYDNVGEEYDAVIRQLEGLKRVSSDSSPAPSSEEASPVSEKKASLEKKKNKIDKFLMLCGILVFVFLLFVSFIFFNLTVKYRENMRLGNSVHLIEMSSQLRLYVEEKVNSDWKVAKSVGDSISDSNFEEGDAAIFRMLKKKKNVWGITDLILYTESGSGVYSDGTMIMNDLASDTAAKVLLSGEYFSVIDSSLIYTVPVSTDLRYGGSRVIAISVVQSMASFLDDMGFSSFDGKAWMYLTDESGVVISKLTNPSSVGVYNFLSLTEGKKLLSLNTGFSEEDILTSTESLSFLMPSESGDNYIISIPVSTSEATLRLFYLVPENVVNDSMVDFSDSLTLLGVSIVVIFAAFAFIAFFYIYTSRKKLFDKELRAKEHMFSLLAEGANPAFALFNLKNPIPEYYSKNALSILGDDYWVLEKTEAGFRMLSSSKAETEMLYEVNAALAGWDGKSDFKSGYIKNVLNSPQTYFEVQLYPVPGDENSFIAIAQDMTKAQQREDAVKYALEAANRASEAKSAFLSNMSHDIRTPLNAIVNMSNFAAENIDNPKELEGCLEIIHESSGHLLHLINDVLDMSRIESGKTVIAAEVFDISAEVRRQTDIIRPLCLEKEQKFITDFGGIEGLTLIGDPLKFSQIIMNLLSNAVKFTPRKGVIRFTAKEIPSLRREIADIRITVEDSGIGISPDYMQYIFEPFSRADDKRISRTEGTGLGLSICKSYIDAMGGTITCESEENKGSVFTVELFFKKDGGAPVEKAAEDFFGEYPFLGKHCLVAEDNPINQTISRVLLERLGFTVDIAADGGECFSVFLHSEPGTYDAVYLDIQMPVMDGYQTAVAIRESLHPQAKTIPIIAMTANVFLEDIEKARVSGMDGYLGKPIMSSEIIEQTDKAFEKRKGG